MASDDASLHVDFAKLDAFLSDLEYDKAIKICDDILSKAPTDQDAQRTKILALIYEGHFDRALSLLNQYSRLSMIYEEAYVLYRLNKQEKALELLRTNPIGIEEEKRMQLESQILYKLGKFDEALQVYKTLIEKHKLDSPEIQTNFLACCAGAGKGEEARTFFSRNKSTMSTFEFTYNAACCSLLNGDMKEAERLLNVAKDTCVENLKNDGFTQQEIDEELGPILTQIGYIKQIQGKEEDAISIYTDIIQKNPEDPTVLAVATNNLAATSHEKVMHSSRKLAQLFSSSEVKEKLSSEQLEIINFNRCILSLQLNKISECRDLVSALRQQFPDDVLPILAASALYYKQGKVQKAKALLSEFAKLHPESSKAKLTQAQMAMEQGDTKGVLAILESIGEMSNKPGIVAARVKLHQSLKETDAAIRLLDQVGEQMKKDDKAYCEILKRNGEFKMSCGRYKEAAEVYEKLLQINKNDLQALPALIMALSKIDNKKAKEYAEKLPDIQGSDINVDELEQLSNLAPIVKRQPREKQEEEKADDQQKEKKQKKKKKRRNKPPKNLDPNQKPDPDRWKPKYARKGGSGPGKRGPQGAASASVAVQKQEGKVEEKKIESPKASRRDNRSNKNQRQNRSGRKGRRGRRNR